MAASCWCRGELASPRAIYPQQRDARLGEFSADPGCAGSSPIQNIGAYGVELQRVCNYVDCINLSSGESQRLSAQACRFGYRDSIFKHEYQDGYAITAVGLRLPKTGNLC